MEQSRVTRRGFSLVELGVVLVVLAGLAIIIVPRLAAADDDETQRVTQAGEDLRRLASAFTDYHRSHGYWPPDAGLSQTPPEMRWGFEDANPFAAPCPIGGRYDYDNIGDEMILRISIRPAADAPMPAVALAQALDAAIDDGVLTSGNFRVLPDNAGYTYAFARK